MKIGLIWYRDEPHVNTTVRFERYMRGFRTLGHDPIVVGTPAALADLRESTVLAETSDRFLDAGWWSKLRLDAAVVITHLAAPELLRILRSTCPWVISIADSDGRVGPRVYPRDTFTRGILQHTGLGMRTRAAKFWLTRYLFGGGVIDRDHLDSGTAAHLITVNSPGARENLAAFFRYYRRPELAAKIVVVPYPVDECFLTGAIPLAAARERRFVAVGRWDDPQKNAPLLAATIRRVLAADPKIQFDVIGTGGSVVFGPLARQYSQVIEHGRKPPEVVANLLRHSRALILSSRWESGPIVANEALCSGCTLVGPNSIPTFAAHCQEGRYGCAAVAPTPACLAAAVLNEMRNWDEGHRDPISTATTWRPRFNPVDVCRQFLEPRDLDWQ